jgi:4-amino-4-deoxy-L-arabinose transferase-like glycosyltransferase
MVALFTAALVLRFGAACSLRNIAVGPQAKSGGADGVEYNALALHLAYGQGYSSEMGQPTSFRAPGFPFFLTVFHALSHRPYPAIYMGLSILGALSCVLTYLLAGQLLAENAARLAGALAVLYPPHIYMATRFDSENLFAPLLALGLLLVVRNLKGGSFWNLLGAGLALGYAALVRAFALLLLPLLVVALLLQSWRQRRMNLGSVAALILSFAAVILPWTLRNDHVHDRFVLIASNGGSTFYGGNNDIVSAPTRNLGAWVSTRQLPGRPQIDQAPDEVSHDRLEWHLGMQWIAQHPGKLPLLLAGKLARLWLPDIESSNRNYVVTQLIGYTPYMLAMFVGLYFCLRRREYRTLPWWPVHLALLATVLTGLIFWGSPRFRDANAPLIAVYSVMGVSQWYAQNSGRRTARLPLPMSRAL